MTRPDPQPGQIYRHFKGNLYKIDRLAVDYPNDLTDSQAHFFFSSANTGSRVDFVAASEINRGDKVVFYEGEDGRIWARSLINFMQVLNDGRAERDCLTTNYYRFELVGIWLGE